MNQKQSCYFCEDETRFQEGAVRCPNCKRVLKQSWEEKVHLKLLEKSESAKDCGEMTVVKIGFLPAIIKEIVDEAIQTREKNIKNTVLEEMKDYRCIDCFGHKKIGRIWKSIINNK